MNHIFDRTKMLIGEEGFTNLSLAKVVVLGLGGVGGSAAETLVRSGIGNITIVDMDYISESNINRQIIALNSTLGKKKTEVMKERLLDINPNVNLKVIEAFILDDNIESIIDLDSDYVLDCIDTVTAKINVAIYCHKNNINLISSMGAGNKLDPSKLTITDLAKTTQCPLAKVIRRELRIKGIEHMEVIYSTEPALEPMDLEEKENPTLIKKRKTPGSVAFVPPVAGIMMAGHVIRKLIETI